MNEEAALIQLALGDWIVVGLYACIVFGIAIWAMRKIKDCGGFLLGKRKMGKLMLAATMFAGGTNATHPMGVAAATFKQGLSGMWLSLAWMLITPFMWIYPPVVRRLRVVNLADAINLRFGATAEMVFKVVSLITYPILTGLGIKSAAIAVEVMTGGAVTGIWALLAITAPTLIYTLMGGVIAAYATDVFQGLLIVVLSFLMIPFAISQAGGVAALDAGIADQFTSLIGAEGGHGFGIWWIGWFVVACLFAAPMASAGGALAARSEVTARMQMFGLVLKRFCTVGWGLVGLFGIALYAGNEALAADPDKVFPMAAGNLLPVVLRGVMVASILGAVMSSIDGGLVLISGIIVKNFYEPYVVKNGSAKHYLVMVRVFATVMMVLGFLSATTERGLVSYMVWMEQIAGLFGVSFLVCLLWRRVTKWGALASVVVMFVFQFGSQTSELVDGVASLPPVIRHWAQLLQQAYAAIGAPVEITAGVGKYLPTEIGTPLYLLPGLFVLVVISLFTKQHKQHAVDEFYARLDTPLGEEHRLSDAGYGVDDLAELDHEIVEVSEKDRTRTDRLLLPDLFRLPKLIASGKAKISDYRIDLIGVAGSIVFVYVFIKGIQWVGSMF